MSQKTAQKTERKPLSKRALEELAQGLVLGPELLAEMKRLEKKGVALYNDDTYTGLSAGRVVRFLLGEEGPSADELAEGIDTASKRVEALAAVRRDKGYLTISIDDLSYRREPSKYGGDHLVIGRWEGGLAYALAWQLGYRRNPNVNGADGLYYVEEGPEWNRSEHYLLAHDFEKRLFEQQPSWLDLLRSKDEGIRKATAKYLGDIADPEEVVLRLVARRLRRLEGEIDFAENARRRERERLAAEAAKRAAERQLDDAWTGFFDDAPAPELAAVEDAPKRTKPERAHPRGVAPELGDSGL